MCEGENNDPKSLGLSFWKHGMTHERAGRRTAFGQGERLGVRYGHAKFRSLSDSKWTCIMWVWSQRDTWVRSIALWAICTYGISIHQHVERWRVRLELMPSGWGDVRNRRRSGQWGGQKLGLTARCSLDPCAGVTTCVSLSWASSPACGGRSPSSAGSVTVPSVSCCHRSTSPTCTACGKAWLSGVGCGTGACTWHQALVSCRVHRCAQAWVPLSPHRGNQTQQQQKVLWKAEWAPGSRLSQNKNTWWFMLQFCGFLPPAPLLKRKGAWKLNL